VIHIDATVSAAVTTLVTGLKSDALAMITTNLPLAGGVLVTVAVVFFGINIFRAIAHV